MTRMRPPAGRQVATNVLYRFLARLLTRSYLGISLGKTRELLHDFFGLTISRPGLLGHLRWGGQLFAPVVDELLELLRQSRVVQGDETGWRIDGQPAWAWCFRDPRLALFLIDRHRSREVLILECDGVRAAQERDRHRHDEPGSVHPVWNRSCPRQAPG
jgi:hypothetical protein